MMAKEVGAIVHSVIRFCDDNRCSLSCFIFYSQIMHIHLDQSLPPILVRRVTGWLEYSEHAFCKVGEEVLEVDGLRTCIMCRM